MPTSAARVKAARASSEGRGSVETVNTGAEVSTDAGTAGSNARVATGMELAGSTSHADACDGSSALPMAMTHRSPSFCRRGVKWHAVYLRDPRQSNVSTRHKQRNNYMLLNRRARLSDASRPAKMSTSRRGARCSDGAEAPGGLRFVATGWRRSESGKARYAYKRQIRVGKSDIILPHGSRTPQRYTCGSPAFLSPAAILAFSPHQSTPLGGRHELVRCRRSFHRAAYVWCRWACSVRMSCMPFVVHHDDRQESRCEHVLALRILRRGVECHPPSSQTLGSDLVAVSDAELTRALRELLAALDRRVPRVDDAGEASIARDAGALREKAMKRLAELACEGVSALDRVT